MAFDYFLKLEGVDGESTDDKHKDWIEIDSFSWGLGEIIGEDSTQPRGGGGAAGKVQIQDFSFVKKIDKASPVLMLSCATGQHMKEGVLIGRKAGDKPLEYLKIKLTDILISGYQTGGSSGDVVPTDQFSLNFAKIEFSYTPQDPRGGEGKTITTTYDLKAAKK
jgi:type VI secretion system secreted protein Hcp